STVRIVSFGTDSPARPCCCVQRWARCTSAMESEPPDTASATCASLATGANSSLISSSEKSGGVGSAAGTFNLRLGALPCFRRLRELGVDLSIGCAGLLFLTEPAEREAELQQTFGRLSALRKITVADQESLGSILVLALDIIRLAEPVLRIA